MTLKVWWVFLLLPAAAWAQTTQPASRPAESRPVYRMDQGDLAALGETFKPVVEKVRGGEVDWTEAAVYAIGEGKLQPPGGGSDFLMAQRAARVMAIRNAVLLSAGVRTGPGGTFPDVERGRIGADAMVQGVQETDSDYDPRTETVTSKVRVPLFGQKGIVRLNGLTRRQAARQWQWPDKNSLHIARAQLVIVDARGKGFRPCLLPRLVTADGQAVFDAAAVAPEQLPAHGPARYVALEAKLSVEDQVRRRIEARALSHSATLRATGVTKDNEIILDEQALRILSANSTHEILGKGGIVVVVDAPVPEGPD